VSYFCRTHSSIRCTPAMKSGLTDHIWAIGLGLSRKNANRKNPENSKKQLRPNSGRRGRPVSCPGHPLWPRQHTWAYGVPEVSGHRGDIGYIGALSGERMRVRGVCARSWRGFWSFPRVHPPAVQPSRQGIIAKRPPGCGLELGRSLPQQQLLANDPCGRKMAARTRVAIAYSDAAGTSVPIKDCLRGGAQPNSLCPILCPPPNLTECYGVSSYRLEPLLGKASVTFRHNSWHSVQVVDSSCDHYLGAGGRRFKSYRPDQYPLPASANFGSASC
jgi:hypothetical protein